MSGVFDTIKHSVNILDVAARYGIEVNRHKKALCPFHPDSNPSLSFKGQRFKCFVCGAGSDVIDLVAQLAGKEPIEVARELDALYCLGLFDKPQDMSVIRKAAQQRERDQVLLDEFKAWEQWACNTWAAYCRTLMDWKRDFAPQSPEDELHPRFVEACQKLDWANHIYESVFIAGSFEAKLEFYRNYAEEVSTIGECLNNTGQSPDAA